MTNDNGPNNEPTLVLVKLWHTCSKWHVENFLHTQHSLLSQYFISFSRPASLYCEHYVHIHAYLTPYRLYMNDRCYQITLQWSTVTLMGAVRNVGWIFIVGAPVWRWLGEYVTLGRTFYRLLLKQEVAAAQLLPNFLPYRIPGGGLN
jgi:hypothetical protein